MHADAAPILEMQGVEKRFGPTVALDGVDLRLERGEVHALIGENGAGKSTLMKVLAGAVQPDAGRITLEGRPYAPQNPEAGRAAGVSMIYQELNLAPHLTVEANMLLGAEETRLGFVRRRRHEARVERALELLGHPDMRPGAVVADLGVGARQLVEIARALVADARIIVLDEPTSSLSIRDAEHLFGVVGRLRERGVGVVWISHFLEEVFRIADRYTVLRNGRSVGSGRLAEVDERKVVELMVGRPLDELFPRVPHAPGDPVLRLEGVAGDPLPRGVDLELRRGEILGVFGLVGAGRTELLRAVYGLAPVREGHVRVASFPEGASRPDTRVAQGLGLLSEDRKEEGLALDRTVAENITLSRPGPIARWGWILPQRRDAAVRRLIDRVKIKCRGPGQPAGDLSGGNQQKAAIARLLHQEADILLLDEPTRGIDVGSKVEVYRLMGELAADGRAVVFVSSYVPELLGVCDRVAVMARGVVREIRPAGDWTEHDVLLAATGASGEAA